MAPPAPCPATPCAFLPGLLQERYGVLLSEKQAVEAKLDPHAVDQQARLALRRAGLSRGLGGAVARPGH